MNLASIRTRFSKIISNPKWILIGYVLLAIFASLQSYLLTKTHPLPGEWPYTFYNNYVIFKQSFFHLLTGKDLFVLYPNEYMDLYKYSPAFSVFFAIFSYLPDAIGLFLWNLLNALVLFFAVYYLPRLNLKQKGLLLITISIELITSMQNSQSNGLMAGLLILAFGLIEKEKYLWATFCLVFTIYIKLFGVIALLIFIFYPKKTKVALYTLFWFVFFALIPLVFVNFEQLKFLYLSWFKLLANDHSISSGLSVIGWLHSWFGLEINKIIILTIGAIMLLLPLIRIEKYKNYSFRLTMLASLLIWVIIFNHRAESPTFIIALSGIAIWFFSQSFKKINFILLLITLVFTCLSPTDIFPRFIRENYFEMYVIKAVPCILIWLKIMYDLLFTKMNQNQVEIT